MNTYICVGSDIAMEALKYICKSIYIFAFEYTKLWAWKDGCICQASETIATYSNHFLYSRGLDVTLASVCHTHSAQWAVHSSPFVSTESWYYLTVNGLLTLNIQWCWLSWLNFTHNWSLMTSWFCYLFTSSKSVWLPSWFDLFVRSLLHHWWGRWLRKPNPWQA